MAKDVSDAVEERLVDFSDGDSKVLLEMSVVGVFIMFDDREWVSDVRTKDVKPVDEGSLDDSRGIDTTWDDEAVDSVAKEVTCVVFKDEGEEADPTRAEETIGDDETPGRESVAPELLIGYDAPLEIEMGAVDATDVFSEAAGLVKEITIVPVDDSLVPVSDGGGV